MYAAAARIRDKWRVALIGTTVIVAIGHGIAAADPGAALRGEPFSDPKRTQTLLPPEWSKRPIHYDAGSWNADLVVALDQQLYPALQPLIKKYAKKKLLKIIVRNGTCGISAGMLLRRTVDIGGYCCPPGPIDRLPGLEFHTMGVAAIAFITGAGNPVDRLTTAQARAIYQGDITRWSEMGGGSTSPMGDRTIKTIARLHCKIRPGSWRLLLGNQDLFGTRLYEVGTIPDMVSQVADNNTAIGYETLWMVRNYKKFGGVKILKVDGKSPTDRKHLLAGRYPLYRTYSITTWRHTPARKMLATELVNYLLQEIERLDPKFGIIPPSLLRRAGWKFKGNELVGEPG